jgi:type II secretory pathway component PulK
MMGNGARASSVGPDSGQHGSALLVVLVLLGLISVLAAVAARSVAGAAAGIGAARATWQAEADVRAGIELAVAAIRKLGPLVRSADASADLAQRRITVRATNERARIDLNRASAPVLARLLESKGVVEGDAAGLAASVIEWRGGSASQKLTALSDSERPFAAFAGFSSAPQPGSELKDGPKQIVGTRFFLHPWQLTSVPGFSRALVASVLPLVTVASGSPQVDPDIAPDGVLAALPGTSAASIAAFRGARDGNTSRATALQLLGTMPGAVTTEAARGWRIEIVVRHQDGHMRRSEAVIAILDGDTQPYRVLYVLDDQH